MSRLIVIRLGESRTVKGGMDSYALSLPVPLTPRQDFMEERAGAGAIEESPDVSSSRFHFILQWTCKPITHRPLVGLGPEVP